jgi:hypothetical protein
MGDPKPNQQNAKQSNSSLEKGSRVAIIDAVKQPINFFALVVLIVEAILAGTASIISGNDRTYLVIGMLGLIFLLVLIVAGMAIFRPEALYGVSTGRGRQVETRSRLVSITIGIVTGIFIFGLFVVIWKPHFIIDPAIISDVSATLTARPIATPEPTSTPLPVLRLIDPNTEKIIPITESEYRLNPGKRIEIEIVPYVEGRKYLWRSYITELEFEPAEVTDSRVAFLVPVGEDIKSLITVCEYDVRTSDCKGEILDTGIIKATKLNE